MRRNINAGTTSAKIGTVTYDPSATGAASIDTIMPEYIGCRTNAYGPLSITLCPVSTRIVLDANVFVCITQNTSQ